MPDVAPGPVFTAHCGLAVISAAATGPPTMACRRLPLSCRPTYTTSETPSPDARRSRHFVLSTSNSHPPSKAPGNLPRHAFPPSNSRPLLIALSVPNAPPYKNIENIEIIIIANKNRKRLFFSHPPSKENDFSSRTLPPRRPRRASPAHTFGLKRSF